MKDKFGVEVRPGNIILYSSCNSLCVGIVREIGYSLTCEGLPNITGTFRIKVGEFNTNDNGDIWLWNSWLRYNKFVIIDRSTLPQNYESVLVKNGY